MTYDSQKHHHRSIRLIVTTFWDEIPNHFLKVELDAFVMMPNHVHEILIITGDGRGE
ncbi:MAG: hypothetical protein ACM3SR_13775 [Ignavibacteriales bacterium]